MARIFITGSADGLGQLCAKRLIEEGHEVVLHARNPERARYAAEKTPGASKVLIADLKELSETKNLASQVNTLGAFDAVIHNAGVYQRPSKEIFGVNTLAPYVLTCLIQKPKRLIYLSSQMHMHGKANLDSFNINTDAVTYSDSKLHVVMLALLVAQKWSDVYSNAVDPGWVPTKMGGRGAPDDLKKGFETQAWLAVSNEDNARVTGKYFFHQKQTSYNKAADNAQLRERFVEACRDITGIEFPG